MRPVRRSRFGPLWLQVLVAVVLGVVLGVWLPDTAAALKPLGDGFVMLIRMALAPIIFGTVVVGIARMGDIHEVGRVGAKALLYFEVVSTVSLIMGLVAVDLLRPGAGMNVNAATLDAKAVAGYATTAQHLSAVDFLLNIIPTSVVGAFARGNILQIILFGVLFGLSLAGFRDRAKPLVDMLDLVLHGLFGIVRMVMKLAPLGTLGAIAYTIGRYGIGSLVQLAQLTGEVWGVSILFVVVVLGGISKSAGVNIFKLMRYIREEILITLGTASSEAVLAPLLVKMERLGCAKSVVGMVMPAGYTFNADGTSIYLGMCAIFIAQATNTPLTIGQEVVILLTLMLTSKGSAGVAGAGFVTLAATLASMNQIPVAGIVLLLGVDRFTNAARAITNIIGNCVATVVVAKWENAFDKAQAERVLE
ncbi:C4-dicarboxylate transporter DctA [Lichenibacterium ramalinae]|uniref:C4-dicarboxylate transporter DctA n=1 Tax=Lichenibacterium ramalinae TaxID=2316527 RepID=A0A4V1RIP9_9HYPH|nr:C4-dicarboxylate transporter DctA [Lichenibacterium ramalinae]RYB04993.1 C4-dicarboxylate transporter DctA [Lichenibacterium ramalinae]